MQGRQGTRQGEGSASSMQNTGEVLKKKMVIPDSYDISSGREWDCPPIISPGTRREKTAHACSLQLW